MKTNLLTTTAAAIFAFSFAAGAPTPLANGTARTICRRARLPATRAAPRPPAAAKPYDGAADQSARQGGPEMTMVDVPKLIGIGYFNATSKGMQDAAKELGNVKVATNGQTGAEVDEQIKFIDNYITRGVDGMLFAANDPVAIAPVLKKALSEGIHVVGYDANSPPTRANGSSTRLSSTASASP